VIFYELRSEGKRTRSRENGYNKSVKLKDKIILITGASKGIGNVLAKRLAQEKARLILVARTESELKRFIADYGNRHKYFVCNLENAEEIIGLVKQIKLETKKLDVLVNVAGVGVYKNFNEVIIADWNKSFALNVTAPFY